MEGTSSPVQQQVQKEQSEELQKEQVECDIGDDILLQCASSTPVCEDTNRGRLLCWGNGEFGQTGRGETNDISCRHGLLERFATTPPGGRVKLVACGNSHTVVVTCADDIYSWGNGTSEQLGNGKKDMAQEAVKVNLECPHGGSIKGVACGGRHTYIWLTSGKLYNFGNNFFAQRGYDFNLDTYKGNKVAPQLMRPLKHRLVVQVACGEKHSLFLFYGGQVAAVGDNSHGQIGSDCVEAVVTRSIDTLSNVIYIACGSHHCLAIQDNGSMYAWGYGLACGSRTGDLGEPKRCQTRRQDFTEVSGGMYHSAGLTANGNVYTWGRGTEGQLGHGEKTRFLSHPRRVPWESVRGKVIHVNCGELYTATVTATGHLYLWGESSHVITSTHSEVVFEPTPVDTGDIPVERISCGAWHAAAVTGHPEGRRKRDGVSDEEEEESEAQSVSSAGSSRGHRAVVRERTSMSLAEFYAPTPEIPRGSPEPNRKILEMGEECKGQRSRNNVRSIGVTELCGDVCHNKMEPWDMTRGKDTTEDTDKDRVKSLSSLEGEDHNVVSSVNGQTLQGVGDKVIDSATVYGQRSKIELHHRSDIGIAHVDERRSSVKPQKDILLSPIELDELLSHDGGSDRTLRDRTRQLLVTSPIKLITSANSAGVRSVVSCDPRPTNHTVQSSTSYATRFVLPREPSMVSNKPMDIVQIMSDFSQRANKLLQLQRHHTVIGLDTGHSTDTCQGRSGVKVMWNRPRLRARPLGQVPPSGKKLKYHKLAAMEMDGRCPLLMDVTQAGGRRRGVPISRPPPTPALQYHPVYSSGMSWRKPGARPSAQALPDTVKTAYIERPPLHPKTIRTRARAPPSVLRSRLTNRTDVGNTNNTSNHQ